jgi:hypothetical protein
MICATNTIYADEITIKFLNCTGKDLLANWTGFKVNVDHEAPNDVLQGQFELPGHVKGVFKTLKMFRTSSTSPDEHVFSFYFITGISGHVHFAFAPYKYSGTLYGTKVSMSSSSSTIYTPKGILEVQNSSTDLVADVLIGCE